MTGDGVREGGSAPRRFPSAPVLAVALLLATLGLVIVRLAPPRPRAADAPGRVFSSLRTHAVLNRLLPTAVPHPAGSEENAAVRQRLCAELTRLGLQPQLQHDFQCGGYGVCAPITNVTAEIPGTTVRAIALMAHYDSVLAGPGAADDAAGVASVLEIVRALQSGPALRHSLLLVFTDGEELGMLGARLFVREHSAAPRIDAVVNLEARGVRGPSTLFRTSSDATGMLAAFAVPRPVASSLAQDLFARLPNETDLSQLLAVGVSGYDLAFVSGAQSYHTPLDSPANLDLGSVQHQGANALALVRSLDRREASGPGRAEPATYFDVLALAVVWWPASAGPALAGSTLALLLAAAVALAWRGRVTALGLGTGMALGLCGLLLAALTALGAYLALRWTGAIPFVWVAFPFAIHAFIGAVATAGALVVARLGRHLQRGEFALAILLTWALLALLVTWRVPGASYLLLVPSFVGAVVALAWALVPGEGASGFLELVPLAVAGLLWWPVVVQLYPAIGFVVMPLNALLVAALVGLAAPSLARLETTHLTRWLAVTGGGGVLALIVALVVPAATPSAPRWTNLAYQQHEQGPAQWLVDASFGTPPPHLLRAAPFEPEPHYLWPGAPLAAFAAPARGPSLPPPAIEVIDRKTTSVDRSLVLRARSQRGSHILSLHFPTGRGVTVAFAGHPATAVRIGGYQVFTCRGVPSSGIEIRVTVVGREPWSGLLVDHRSGLPDEGRFLEQARDESAVTAHFGDDTLASTTLRL